MTIQTSVGAHERPATGQYDQEVESNHRYAPSYRPKPIDEQVRQLVEFFPQLRREAATEIACITLPPGAEGWFAIPRWDRVAPCYDIALATMRKCWLSWFRGAGVPSRVIGQYLRVRPHTEEMLQRTAERQAGCDILIIPAQFGLRHRGRSVARAREVMAPNEFGLDAFAVGAMLTTHPERLSEQDELWVDCAGGECGTPDGDGNFTDAPYYGFDTALHFGAHAIDLGNHFYCGSATGFLP